VNEAYQTLEQGGVNFSNEPMDMAAWGIRIVHFRHTEMNPLELFSNLPKEQCEGHLIEQETNFIKVIKKKTGQHNERPDCHGING
jgi:hypothetical protein